MCCTGSAMDQMQRAQLVVPLPAAGKKDDLVIADLGLAGYVYILARGCRGRRVLTSC